MARILTRESVCYSESLVNPLVILVWPPLGRILIVSSPWNKARIYYKVEVQFRAESRSIERVLASNK
jgi:hypothetical protein